MPLNGLLRGIELSYYLAKSLTDLRAETNAKWPNRDKGSDGWIGDTSHQARQSDHNPDWGDGGVVRAIDVDKDGINVDSFLEAVKYDPRTSYVIYNYRIWGGSRWRTYEGSNPHTKHIHVSIKHTSAAERGGSWGLGAVAPTGKPSKPSKPVGAKVKDQSWTNKPNGSTTFPTDYVDLVVDGKFQALTKGAIQILMHQLGYRKNKQWDGKIGKLGYTDLMNWLQDVGYYKHTTKGVKLLVDGKPGYWFWYELQRYLKDRKHYKGILDGKPGGMTYEAIQRWLNANNGQ